MEDNTKSCKTTAMEKTIACKTLETGRASVLYSTKLAGTPALSSALTPGISRNQIFPIPILRNPDFVERQEDHQPYVWQC